MNAPISDSRALNAISLCAKAASLRANSERTPLTRGLFCRIDSRGGELVDFAKNLIAIPTVNPPGDNYGRIVALLDRRLKAMGFKTRRYITPRRLLKRYKADKGSPRVTLVGRWDVGAAKTLHINGHYDVVPATSEWKMDPFRPSVSKGKLYGRGAEDMKGNIACMIFAVEALKSEGIRPSVNIEFSFVPDEESGGMTGLGHLVERGILKPDYVLGEGYWNEYISIGNKGVLWLEIEVKGRSCHGSSPYKGVNAFEKMLEVAGELKKLQVKVSKRKTRYETADRCDRFATLVMGGEMRGGIKVNVVPDKASFTIDRRVLPEESLAEAEKEIRKTIAAIIRKDGALRVKVKVLAKDVPVVVKDKTILRAMGSAVRKVMGRRPKFAIQPGGTDLRFFIKKGIGAVGYGPCGEGRFHADDECVSIDSMIKTAKVFAQFIINLR